MNFYGLSSPLPSSALLSSVTLSQWPSPLVPRKTLSFLPLQLHEVHVQRPDFEISLLAAMRKEERGRVWDGEREKREKRERERE